MIETEPENAAEDSPVLPGIIAPQGGVIPAVNGRWDAPTIYADAVQGAMLSPQLVKITFIEQFLTDGEQGELQARYVLNLAVPAPQLRAMGDLFIRMADGLDQTLQGIATSGQ